ncbi:MAG: resuscitation-promoting factor RpfB [Solirubrobacteraceae bacterium]
MRARMWLCLMGCALAFPASAAAKSELSGEVPALTIAEGRASVVGVLSEKFGARFTVRRGFRRDCYRVRGSTVRCRVRWDHGSWRYAGAVDMKNDPDEPSNSILYTTTIRRTRMSQPAPSPSPSCDSSYKGACLKPNVSDYDCAGGAGDGPYYAQGPITVVGDDHYDLDRDGDGIACES